MGEVLSEGKRQLFPRQFLRFLQRYWAVLLLSTALVVFLKPMLSWWWDNWTTEHSYYSHGPLVPFIAGFMIWTNRKVLSSAPIRSSWWGLVLIVLACPLYLLSLLVGIESLYPLVFFAVLIGITLLVWGTFVLKTVLNPIAFLITMVPFAEWILDSATAKAQLLSAAVAEKFLTLTGYEVVRYGNQIESPGLPQPLLIGTPCSGLRLLISLITFSWFFTYVSRGPRWKKALLVLFTFPLSVLINSLRITMIGYAGFWTGSADAMSAFHDYSGYIGLIICFFVLFGVARLLGIGQIVSERQPEETRETPAPRNVYAPRISIALTTAFLLTTAHFGSNLKPLYDVPKGSLNRKTIPTAFGSWNSYDVPIHPAVKKQLSMGDLFQRIYVDHRSGRNVDVFLNASLDIQAFHDPHLCLPGGGTLIANERIVEIKFDKPRRLTVRATVLETQDEYDTVLVVYWYMLADRSFATTPELWSWQRSTVRQDMLQLVKNPTALSQLRAEVQKRQITWYRFSTAMIAGDDSDFHFLETFIKEFIGKMPDFGKT